MSDSFQRLKGLARHIYRRGVTTTMLPHKSDVFPEAELFESHYREIRAEILGLPGGVTMLPKVHEVMPAQENLFTNDKIPWRFVPLYAFGREHEENLRLCPMIKKLLAEVPNLLAATISVFEPGKHLPPHRGPYAGLLRYHLAIVVPPQVSGKEPSGLKIEDTVIEWREGEGFIFDDSYEHEAWNNSDRPRIVLIIDILNPTLTPALRGIDCAVRTLVNHLPLADRYMRGGTLLKGERNLASYRK